MGLETASLRQEIGSLGLEREVWDRKVDVWDGDGKFGMGSRLFET